jgi:hypothetical protein
MVIPILSTVLAILVVLALRQLLALSAAARSAGGLHEGWMALQAQNADRLTQALLSIHKWQQRERAWATVRHEVQR